MRQNKEMQSRSRRVALKGQQAVKQFGCAQTMVFANATAAGCFRNDDHVVRGRVLHHILTKVASWLEENQCSSPVTAPCTSKHSLCCT